MAGTQRILYTDKVLFQVSPLDEINKATAANYNELKSVINVNAQALDDILSITTGDVSAIQNTFTSDISAQTGTKTFTGLDWDITTAGRTSTGDVNFLNFKKDAVSKYRITVDGIVITNGASSIQAIAGIDTITWDGSDNVSIPNGEFEITGNGTPTDTSTWLNVAPDTDAVTILGRLRIDSRATDTVILSHFDLTGNTQFGIKLTVNGDTRFNAVTGRQIQFQIASVTKWLVDLSGNLDASTGVDLNLSTTSTIQWGGIDSITGDGTGDVTIPNGKLNTTPSTTLAAINVGSFAGDPSALVNGDYWTNSSTNKLRARENGVSVDVIGGGVSSTTTVTISSAQLLDIADTPIELIAAPGVNKIIVILSGYYSYIFNTTAYSGGVNDVRMQAFYAGTIKNATGGFIDTSNVSSVVELSYGGSNHNGVTSDFENKAIEFTNNGVDPTLGDGTVEVTLSFIIMDV